MTFLSEDSTYVVGILCLIAGAFIMALRHTQRGKYLYWAIGAAGLGGVIFVVEQVWVTDNERIEQVVYDLRQAVLDSNPEGVLTHLTEDVEYVQNGTPLSGSATRALIKANLSSAKFEFVHINNLQISSGRQTRRGKAEFSVYAKGSLETSLAQVNVGTANSMWSLGFEEASPGAWKVNRITPVSLPNGSISVPRSFSGRDGTDSEQQPRPRQFKGIAGGR